MTLIGHVQNGAIVLDDPAAVLPEGFTASIELKAPERAQASKEERPLTLAEQFAEFIGVVDDWPTDFAENHDHYIHGTPKNK
jgi:hypothetical protein